MIKYSSINIRTLSLLGERGAFGKLMSDLALTEPGLIVGTADQATGAALNGFKEKFPDKFINFGISEQNALGVCSGLANEGFTVFLAFQSVFTCSRCLDQVRVNMGYMNLPVKLVGIFSGLTQSDCGPTHYALNDFATFRSIPNIVILSPSDALQTAKCIESASAVKKPVYIRLTGKVNTPMIYKEDFNYEIGKSIKLKEGKDICIISTGSMVYTSLNVARKIEESLNLSVTVIDMHTIKPLDEDAVKSLTGYKLVVSVEEHSILGGLGSSIAEIFVQNSISTPLKIIGAEDRFYKAGEYEDVLQSYGLDEDSVYQKIENTLKIME